MHALEPSPHDVDASNMISDASPAIRSSPGALTRVVLWAVVGALGGFLVGFLMSDSTCHDGAIYNCYPTQELKIVLGVVAGLLVGSLASRLRRSMTDARKTLMTTMTVILLVVLLIAGYARVNPWSCHDDAFCEGGPGPFAST
jgi:nitrate reductase gamma subunit